MSLAEVRYAGGRAGLFVADIVVAMEGDVCRSTMLPDELYEPIPTEELATASIGGEPIKGMDRGIVRFFRREFWNVAMLEFVAERINSQALVPEPSP